MTKQFYIVIYTIQGEVLPIALPEDVGAFEAIKQCVGGYLEVIPINLPVPNIQAFADEEGKLKRLPQTNLITTTGEHIVGSVGFAKIDSEDVMGMTMHEVQAVRDYLKSLPLKEDKE